MKLYATTTSERASKGQGGNEYLYIDVKDCNEEIRIHMAVLQLKNGDIAINVLIDEKPVFQEIIKGNKQKDDNKIHDCSYCNENTEHPTEGCDCENCIRGDCEVYQ